MLDNECGAGADEVFRGRCVGGPYNGQLLVSTSSVKRFYRPVVAPVSYDQDDQAALTGSPVRTFEAGHYVFTDRQWLWVESERERLHQQTLRGLDAV